MPTIKQLQQRKNKIDAGKLIRMWDDPILKQNCDLWQPSDNIDLVGLYSKMLLVCRSLKGVGLAAPQIGVAKRIILVKADGEWIFMVNPFITDMSASKSIGVEGCLSYPGVRASVYRYDSLNVNYKDIEGKKQTRFLLGLSARIVQHEYDHILGICLIGDEWRKNA